MSASRAGLAGMIGLLAGLAAGALIWGDYLELGSGVSNGKAGRQPTVRPADFALLPCDPLPERRACAIIAAGGKRVLVGAPAGIAAGAEQNRLWFGRSGLPDAVLLMTLEAEQIEGLDEIRNRIWEADIAQSIPLIGSLGVSDISAALDQAFLVSDAVTYISGNRQNGFDGRAFAPRTPVFGASRSRTNDLTAQESLTMTSAISVFDTGDLQIFALAAGRGRLAYRIEYSGTSATLAGCGGLDEAVSAWPETDYFAGCGRWSDAFGPRARGDWPLSAPIFFVQDQP